MEYAIKVSGLVKSFGGKVVLNTVDVNFEKGKIHGIIGRNGSGKTLLLKSICGFLIPDKGEIIVGGKKVGTEVEMPESTGIIIETPGFLPMYSGFRNLQILSRIQKEADNEQIAAAIRAVGLDPESKKHVGKYSLGMRQRLAIAQSFMGGQRILLLDEPMNGLDKLGLDEMRELFLEFRKQGKTILIASHSAEDISILCDTVHEMDNGEIARVL